MAVHALGRASAGLGRTGPNGPSQQRGLETAVTVLKDLAPEWYPWQVLDAEVELSVVGLKKLPAVPQWNGSLPIALESRKPKSPPANTAETKPAPAPDEPLVHGVPSNPDPRLKLNAEKGELRLRSQVVLEDDTDRCFLTRWWLNGQPVRLVPHVAMELRHKRALQGKQIQLPMTLTWQVEEVLTTIGAKPGDKVAAQVLYCREGWTAPPSPPHMKRAENTLEILRKIEDCNMAPVLLTNQVEWTIPTSSPPTTAPSP